MYDSMPTMLWSAAYAVACLRQQVDSPNELSDRQVMFLSIKAAEEISQTSEVYLYGE